MSSSTPLLKPFQIRSVALPEATSEVSSSLQQQRLFLAAAAFLVSVPVFFQAPLVRLFPLLSLVLTGGWLGLSAWLLHQPRTKLWGDLLLGFSLTWLAGSLYWGWLRAEPLLHLPIEAIGLPFALWGLARGKHKMGNWFYLGSLFGTAMTDAYFYIVNLIPHWRQLMQVSPSEAPAIVQNALAQMQTPWGWGCAIGMVLILLVVGCVPLRSEKLYGWVFSGAVLSTILVDSLFWVAATTASVRL